MLLLVVSIIQFLLEPPISNNAPVPIPSFELSQSHGRMGKSPTFRAAKGGTNGNGHSIYGETVGHAEGEVCACSHQSATVLNYWMP